jgi:hypothetical protein
MVRRWAMVLVLALVCAGIAACAPLFDGTTPLSFTANGPLVTVSWPAATEEDAGQFVATYHLRVDGGSPIAIAGTDTSCVLTGLAAGTTYALEITAVNNAGQDSASYGGDLAASGRVVGSYTTPAGIGDPSPRRCVSPTDTDGDRLPNAVETNTGTFVGAGSTGTNPNVADTDGDAIGDGDETLGTLAGLNLPAMGTKPTKKDLLAEFDWFNDNLDPGICGAHSHRPTAGAISRTVTAYATAPVPNPDGTTGVNFIADYGQGGAFTGGNLIADANGVIAGGVSDAEFLNYKAANFASNRSGYFRYVVDPHRYNTTSDSSGQAEINGDDMIVSLQCYGSDGNVANTIVHEMGHILNLRHGGDVNTNYKPNYNSVMNYQFQFPGIDTGCDGIGDGLLSYSVGTRAALNEFSLLETAGICNDVDKDWNGNGIIDASPVAVDINGDGGGSTLTDYNDWANLVFTGLLDGDGAAVFDEHDHDRELITEQPVPASARTTD